eukprot:764211-Hanusia_phi.AAC.1
MTSEASQVGGAALSGTPSLTLVSPSLSFGAAAQWHSFRPGPALGEKLPLKVHCRSRNVRSSSKFSVQPPARGAGRRALRSGVALPTSLAYIAPCHHGGKTSELKYGIPAISPGVRSLSGPVRSVPPSVRGRRDPPIRSRHPGRRAQGSTRGTQ